MDGQIKHGMLPEATHDELARQNFVRTMKMHIFQKLSPGNKVVYEQVAKPEFVRRHQRSPQNRHEIRQAMQDQPHYRWWGALQRINQEILWDAVDSSVSRQLPELIERARDRGKELGTLTLDPNFQVPAYQKAVDIHCMPGSYHSEFTTDDVAAGATYDRGVYQKFSERMKAPEKQQLRCVRSCFSQGMKCDMAGFMSPSPRNINIMNKQIMR